jgi:hypothetical protein
MSILALRDNALFMVSFRERTRPQLLLAAAAVSALILTLMISTCYLNDTGNEGEWAKWAFTAVALAQGAALFFAGSFTAGQAASREVKNGTLDFHRISPTNRFHQVIGLLLGAPILEWCTFAATLPVSVVLGFMANVPVIDMVSLYAGIAVSALFTHSVAIALGLSTRKPTALAREHAVGVLVPVGLLILSSSAMPMGSATLYHTTSLPLFVDVLGRLYDVNATGPDAPNWELLNNIYHVALPSIAIILLVQIPFMVMTWLAAARAISRPDHPAFSKSELLVWIGLVLAFFVGDALPALADTRLRRIMGADGMVFGMLLYTALALGLWGSWIVTPYHLIHMKGLRRMRKLGRTRLLPLSDSASNLPWLGGFTILFAASYLGLLPYFEDLSMKTIIIAPVAALFYVLWPAQALEYFRLSPLRSFRVLFIIVLAIPWFFFPLFGVITGVLLEEDVVSQMLVIPSPFFSLGLLVASGESRDVLPIFPLIAVGFNGVVASVMLILASIQRAAVRKEAGL